jgi:hypothetical protein
MHLLDTFAVLTVGVNSVPVGSHVVSDDRTLAIIEGLSQQWSDVESGVHDIKWSLETSALNPEPIRVGLNLPRSIPPLDSACSSIPACQLAAQRYRHLI